MKQAGYVRTQLIHRRNTGPSPWWRTVTIAEIPGVIDPVGADMLAESMFSIARSGFRAVVFRPALVDLGVSVEPVKKVIDAAHRVGLYALVRLSGADHTPAPSDTIPNPFYGYEGNKANLIVRAREPLKAGADGIDLGRIEEAPGSPDAQQYADEFTLLTRFLLAELADFSPDHILTAGARTDYQSFYHHHLEEEWLHHLRDDRLHRVAFQTDALKESITQTFNERDRIGAVPVWKAMLPRLTGTPGVENVYPGSWEDGATPERRSAMRLLIASLPGAIYLPFGFSGGHVDFEGAAVRPSPAISDAEKARVRHTTLALRIRAEHELGNGSFAWVEGLDWQEPGVAVVMTGGILGVLNTTDHTIEVALDNQLLLRSDSTEPEAIPVSKPLLRGESLYTFTTADRENQNKIPSGTTAWFRPQRIEAPGI